FIRPRDFGEWRASAEMSYGVSSDITAVVSGALFERGDRTRWLSTAGIRTGLSGFAIKADLAAGDGGAFAISGGVGGRIGASAVTVSHVEYSGDFIDETRGLGTVGLKRATEVDFNTTLELGNPISGYVVPVTARARRVQSANGITTTDATLRASTRLSGVLASNTLDYSHTAFAAQDGFSGLESRSRLFGNFDLATLGRSRTRGRLSLGYQILPEPDIVTAAVEVDHAIDEDTAIRASLGYLFETQSTQIGLSAVRDFDRFSVALDGAYAFVRNEHSIGLRLGFSFGRDPLRGGFFIARPGLSNNGLASVRAFRDLDGDGIFGAGDTALPNVSIVASNRAVPTETDGIARLGNLSAGRGVSLQIDESSLPDIDLAAGDEGMEIVPRPGRIHTVDFPIVALSEVEGALTFQQSSTGMGVSGVRLKLQNEAGEDAHFSKTEIDGYFFFERVRPGTYRLTLDEQQAERLNLCTAQDYSVSVGYEADLITNDITIGICDEPNQLIAKRE
ncbi:MAG: carboxypeptidase-like regulatory domain-containing protein, partial [Pontixanthobacter sp.]